MSIPLVIYGAGGFGKELRAMLERNGRAVHGFIDDGIQPGTSIDGFTVIGGGDWLLNRNEPVELLFGLGDPGLKEQIANRLAINPMITIPSAVCDRSAVITDPERVEVAEGSLLTPGVVLTTGIRIGRHVLVNLNTTIGHDAQIGDFTSIMPGCNIAGLVRIGKGVFIGSGANLLNGVTIGDGSMVGAGSVVNKDVPPGKKVVGVPAREMKI